MHQQWRRHNRLEHLGIPCLLFKLSICIDLPVMLDNLHFGAFQDELCADILLPDADQRMSVGVHLFIVRQIHDSLFHRQRRAEFFQRALFLPAVAGDADFLLRILRRLRCGRLLRFLRRVKHAELLSSVIQDVRPLFAALSELGTLQIQDDLTEPLNLLILLSALFPERIDGALQYGQLLLNCKKYFRLLHAAFTTLHVYSIRHKGGKILLVFFSFFRKTRTFFSKRFRAFPEQTLSSG